MDSLYQYAWLIPVLPLAGAMLLGLGLIAYNKTVSNLRKLSSTFIVSLTGAGMFYSFAILWSQIQGHPTYTRFFEWASAGDFHLSMGYTIDHLTALMLVIVTDRKSVV